MLLTACGNGASSSESVQSEVQTTTASETATYQQIIQEKAKEMMQAEDGHIIVDVRRQDEYDSSFYYDNPGTIFATYQNNCIPEWSLQTDLHKKHSE